MSIRSYFDKELENLNLDLLKMGNMVEEAIDKSIIALRSRDDELANNIIIGDKDVDNMERTIESRALKLLLQQQPVAKDLRTISTALKVITDMERIGDQAADIAEISLRFKDYAFIKELIDIPRMAEIASNMVKQALDAFVRRDLELSKVVINRDDEVDNLFEIIKIDLIDLIGKNKEYGDQAFDLMMIAKYLERIADHAVNIAEWVNFLISGIHRQEKIL